MAQIVAQESFSDYQNQIVSKNQTFVSLWYGL